MIQNDYSDNLKQFTITNAICTMQHIDKVTYDETFTKGVLLPLRFQFHKFLEHGNNLKNMHTKLLIRIRIIQILFIILLKAISDNVEKIIFPYFFRRSRNQQSVRFTCHFSINIGNLL